MTPLRIVADDKIPFLPGVAEKAGCEVRYMPGRAIDRAAAAWADALIIRTRTRCDAALLTGGRVKFIGTATIGYDHIDTAFLAEHGIIWRNAPGCNSSSVRQYVLAALLHLADKHHFDLGAKTIGVVGCGNVGGKVAAAAAELGMRVLVNDPPLEQRGGGNFCGNFCDLTQLQRECDFITLHTSLETGGVFPTWHLADAKFLSGMRRSAFLLNSSRGEVCDNAALKQALRQGLIAGAVLDVWENEPEIDRELLTLTDPATPHIAGYSADGKANGTTQIIRELAAFFHLDALRDFAVTSLPALPDWSDMPLPERVRRSYDIAADDRRLRESPDKFEELRGNYPVRREFFPVTR